MTHIEFKTVVEALDIKYIQVIVDESEYKKFKEIDLFSEQQNIFQQIDEWLEENEEFEKDDEIIAFWLDLNDDFKIIDLSDLFSDPTAYIKTLIFDETDNFKFKVKNQIILNFDKFIDLIG